MKFNPIQLAILATAFASAAAALNGVTCQGPSGPAETYTSDQVTASFQAFKDADKLPKPQRPAAGTRSYPQQYGHGSHPPDDAEVVEQLDVHEGCETGQKNTKYFEFPLTKPNPFNGGPQGSQGPDRLVAIAKNPGQGGTRDLHFCLAITHRGDGGDGSFVTCSTNT